MSRHDEESGEAETFGARLKKARVARKLTQAALAIEVANATRGKIKMDGSSISRYERGEVASPRLDVISAFAGVLDEPLSYFTGAVAQADRLEALEDLVARIWQLNVDGFEKIRQALGALPEAIAEQFAPEARGAPQRSGRVARGAPRKPPQTDVG